MTLVRSLISLVIPLNNIFPFFMIIGIFFELLAPFANLYFAFGFLTLAIVGNIGSTTLALECLYYSDSNIIQRRLLLV